MILKWIFDRVVALIGLLVLWPVLLIVAVLGMYRGVMRPCPHPRSAEAIEGFAAYRGCQAGCNYAEAFEVVLRRY